MGYTLPQIAVILAKADRTMYKIGAIAYDDMFNQLDESLDYDRDIIYIYKVAVEYADNFYVGTDKLDTVVERLGAKVAVYDFGQLTPIYSDSTIVTQVVPVGAALDDLSDVTITNVQNNQTLRYSSSLGQWVNVGPGAATRNRQQFTATLNQTVFVTSFQFESGLLDVYLNGVKLSPPSYTTFGNYTITLADGSLADDIVEVIAYAPETSFIDLSGYVPTSRTLTINGVTYDLSANRSWTVTAGLSSVGLSMPSAFTVSNSPLTANGTISVIGAGTTAQYIRGDGTLATFPTITSGTVTSVDMSVPTGLTISGNPITSSGTLAVGLASGYSIPTTASQATWNTAYNDSIVSAGVTGTSTKTLTLNQQDGGTVTASWSDIDTGLTSVGLSMPSAFAVSNSPLTSNGTLAVTGAGTADQYVRGDGQLANFPTNGGGGSSVNYYLNGSVSQGTFGGDTYYEMSKTPIIGAGTNFTRTNAQGNGYIASFITDAGDPALLNIPGGNWNVEFYFQASSGGGNPSFYAELYKVSSANVFTLIGSGSTNPEGITNGTAVDQYFTSIPVPQTALLATDRIAIRIFVTPSGRTITLHTEDNNLCEVLTTFSTGLNALNGLTAQVQYFATGTSGTDFAISSATDTHTFNLPIASGTNTGKLSNTDWTTFNNKVGGTGATGQVAYWNGTNSQTGSNNLFWDAANSRLGIGTNTPAVTLDVRNGVNLYTSGASANGHYLELISTTSTDGYVNFRRSGGANGPAAYYISGGIARFSYDAGTGDTILGAYANSPLLFFTNSAERARLTAAGRLLLGTTTEATYLLDIVSASTPIARFTGPTNAYIDITDGTVNSRIQNSGGLLIGTTTSHDLILRTNSVSRLTITAAGNVGIGTTTPATKLEVVGASGIQIRNGATDGFSFQQANTNSWAWTGLTAGSTYIIQNANLLVGTTTDSGYKLDVNGTARVSGATGTILTLNSTNGTGYSAIKIDASGVEKGLIGFGTYLTSDGGVAIRTAASTPFTIAIGGGVPTLTLASSGAATFSSSATATSFIPSGSAIPTNGMYLPSANTLGFATNSTIRATLDSSGNLGLGTSSPAAKVDIAGAGTAVTQLIWSRGNNDSSFVSSLRTGDAGTSAYQGSIGCDYFGVSDFARIKFFRDSTNGGIHFFTGDISNNGTEKMRINANGNLLVGTTTDAGYKLDVNGTARVSGNLQVTTTSGNGITITTNDVTTLKMNSTGGTKNWGFATTNLAVNDFGIYQSNAAGGDPISAGASKLYFNGTTGAATFSSSVTATTFYVPNGGDFGWGDGSTFIDGDASNQFIRFIINSSERARFNPSGNLLLGSTSDNGSRLQVSGAGTFSSSVTASSININNGDTFINVVSTLRGLQFGFAGPSHGSYRAAVMGGAENYGSSDSGMLTFHTQNGYVVSAIPPERMRITSGGNLLVGTTTDNGNRLQVSGAASFTNIITLNTSFADAVTLVVNGNTGSGVRQRFINQASSGAYNWQIGTHISSVNQFEILPSTAIDGTTFTTPVFKILATGAATFSSSVQAGGGSTNASAILQADSTTKGFLPPRMTTTQKNAIGTPAAGLMVFDTTLVKLCVYNGTTWETITSI